jgi:hypothetical protein
LDIPKIREKVFFRGNIYYNDITDRVGIQEQKPGRIFIEPRAFQPRFLTAEAKVTA